MARALSFRSGCSQAISNDEDYANLQPDFRSLLIEQPVPVDSSSEEDEVPTGCSFPRNHRRPASQASCMAYTVHQACVRCEVHCCFLRNKQLCRFETLEQELQRIQQLAKQNIRKSSNHRPLERQPWCKRKVSPKLSKELSVPLRGQKHTGGRLHSISQSGT